MNTAKPTPPNFPLRHLSRVAYAMSIFTGALGQVLFFGAALTPFIGDAAWAVALLLAAFAEAVMAAAGDLSMHHRVEHRAWIALLLLSIAVSMYAALMNLAHFWTRSTALAFTFGGASIVGFLLHLIDGHIRVAAYLRMLAVYEAAPAVAPKTPRAARPPHAAREATVSTPAPPLAGVDTVSKTNVTPIRQPQREAMPLKEQAYLWFAEQVTAAGGNVMAVSGPDIDKHFGKTDYLKKEITTFRQRYQEELASKAATN